MPEMPTLGAEPQKSPVIPVAVTAVVVGLLVGGIFWVKNRPSESTKEPAMAAPAVPAPQVAEGDGFFDEL